MRHIPRRSATVSALTATALAVGLLGVPLAQADDVIDPATERYRPLVHYTPQENWMNDPNGLLYHDGTYHLFYQYNPAGTRWGNMSWGHATSTDLLHWEEKPVAIPQTFNEAGEPIEDIFSGSAVVDHHNTSGLGTAENPPLVAIYTSAYTDAHPDHAGKQAQSLAYSTDDGETWTKYEDNPVLDRDSANFRDPKVFWYEGEEESYWVMVAVEATDYEVVLYRSDDLKDWDYLSTFGPANSVGGIWECPDLFPLAVDGDPDNVQWVMVVNLNPGSVAGGSGGQYFVGDFDGVEFTSTSTVGEYVVPEGELFAGFDDGTYGGWTVDNEEGNWLDGPFGAAPATGALGDQSPVTGFLGTGLVNGFLDGDWPVGTLESPEFTVSSDFINFLVGGGRHPHVPGGQLTNEPPAGTTLFDFEGDQNLAEAGWELTGNFEAARNPSTAGGEYFLGDKRINTWEGGPRGDDNVGTLTSPSFTIDGDHISFLIGGGARADGTLQAELVVDGETVRAQTGPEAGALNWRSWDVSELRGAQAQIRIRDEATGGWGHLTFDHVVIGDEPALVRSDETSVNLVVDGEIVRTATGADSESLDWTSWNVKEFEDRQATIRIIDNNRSGWGHILADHFLFSDTAATSRLESYDWLDWGKDYYATVSFSNVPDDRRVMIGWMNNWDYANDIPTGRWRSSMTLPREVSLVTTDKGPRLVQKVVDEFADLHLPGVHTESAQVLDGTVELPAGDTVQIDAVFTPGATGQVGLTVLGSGASGTHIGYDAESGRLFVDRTESGNTDFHPLFASVNEAPLALQDGRLTLRVIVDRASVEVFAQDGLVTVTDQVFPLQGADALSVWGRGAADARLESLTVTPLAAAMWASPDDGDGDGDGGGTGAEPTDPGTGTDDPQAPADTADEATGSLPVTGPRIAGALGVVALLLGAGTALVAARRRSLAG